MSRDFYGDVPGFVGDRILYATTAGGKNCHGFLIDVEWLGCPAICMGMSRGLSETGFYTPPPLEGKIATDTCTPSPARVVYTISGPMGGGFLYTTGAEAENSAVKFSKESVPPLYKNRSSSLGVHLGFLVRMRRRSGEGVVRGNGGPKGSF